MFLPESVSFPLKRILRTPRVLDVILPEDDRVDTETVLDVIYDMVELAAVGIDHFEPFEWVNIQVMNHEDYDELLIINEFGEGWGVNLSNGERAFIESKEEMDNAANMYSTIVSALETKSPELVGNISLDTLPLPDNNYLFIEDKKLAGRFSLLDNPSEKYDFVLIDLGGKEWSCEIVKVSQQEQLN